MDRETACKNLGLDPGYARVPVTPTAAMVRPLLNCPPEDIFDAWDAMLKVVATTSPPPSDGVSEKPPAFLRGYIEAQGREIDALYPALERAEGCIKSLLAGTPVRDADETLAEISAALCGHKRPSPARCGWPECHCPAVSPTGVACRVHGTRSVLECKPGCKAP